MTVHLYARIDCYRLGAHSMTVTESSGGSALIALTATTGSRFYHGDSTHNTGDGKLPTDGGTVALCPKLTSLLNSAGLANTYAVSWAPTTGKITIARSTGTATFSLTFSTLSDAGERMRLLLGFDGDQSSATTHTSDQSCRFWYAFDGAETDDSGRQPRSEVPRGFVALAGAQQVYGVSPYSRAYGRRWVQQFASHAQAHNSQDATGGDIWTLERLFEHLVSGERFLWFPYGTTTFKFANRTAVYALSQEGIDGWEIRRMVPNSDLYWAAPFDCIEVQPGDPEGADPTLFEWGDFTVTRSTVATYRTSAATLEDAAVDELRYDDAGDGYGPLALFEGARTNLLLRTETLDGYWAEENATLTNNVALDPFGAVNAVDVESTTSGAGYNRSYMTSVVSAGSMYTFSVWYRDGDVNTGAHDYSISVTDGITPTPADITRTGTWTRARVQMTPAASPMAAIIYPHTGGDSGPRAASGDDARYIAAQVELGRFASSYIRSDSGSTTTRTADTATLASAGVPLVMLSGVWQWAVLPTFASSDMTSGDIAVLVSFDNANNSLRIRHNGSDVKIEAYDESTVRASSLALTWSADQRLLITVNCPAGTITVTGATTGNGVGSTGTAWTWACATGIRVGGNYSGTAEAFCRFELPRAA